MAASFFFYDLETTGLDKKFDRIMQFAGQRTDLNLNPIGEPVNILIKLTPDVVPSPDAVLLTGITPQMTLDEGVTESEFLKIFYEQVVQPGTIFLGYNSVRFDDEFMRNLHYRNFYDAYEWQWCGDCSKWDLLDVVRMTRALRPEGIEWPVGSDGKANNRLEQLTVLNGIDHIKAHDASSDVEASIEIARLLRKKQPDLFEYLLESRGKKECRARIDIFVQNRQPFLYASGRYPADTLHTTAVWLLAHHVDAGKGYGYVYDLRHDPAPFMDMSVEELMTAYTAGHGSDISRLPVKIIKYNHCPAVAPIGPLKEAAVQERLKLRVETVQANLNKLRGNQAFAARIIEAIERVEAGREYGGEPLGDIQAVDGQLYGGDFFSKEDKRRMEQVRTAAPKDCAALEVVFADERLQSLFPLFKARNYLSCLHDDERADWDAFCRKRLMEGGQNSRLARYFKRLDELARDGSLTEDKRYLLSELQLYGEAIMPVMEMDEAGV